MYAWKTEVNGDDDVWHSVLMFHKAANPSINQWIDLKTIIQVILLCLKHYLFVKWFVLHYIFVMLYRLSVNHHFIIRFHEMFHSITTDCY